MTVRSERVHLGHYAIGKLIGVGTYACVYLAEHSITGTKVAIKIIDKTKLCAEDKHRLFREVQIMKVLRHPNVIQLYQVIETHRYIHLVSKYAQNGELFEHVMNTGRLKEDDARRYFIQICRAISYCHDKGIVHRDLKIENVLLDEHRNVKIADFGFSNYFKPCRLLDTYCGSPQYAAPEIFDGKSYDGTKSDVWSMGIILYVLVTGGCPFDGENEVEVRRSVLSGKFRTPFYVSHECEHLIRGMLCMDPKKRLNISQILSHQWVLAGLPHDQDGEEHVGEGPKLNEHVLNLMQSIGIPKAEVFQSYNSYRFNDFTAIYKLLTDQLHSRGEIDTAPITAWLQKELANRRRSSAAATSDNGGTTQSQASRDQGPCHVTPGERHHTAPIQPRCGLDKVFHQAKTRALSAIFNKSSTTTTTTASSTSTTTPPSSSLDERTKAKHRDLKIVKGMPSPLVSSLISPRTVLSGETPKFTLFPFGQTRKSSTGSSVEDPKPNPVPSE